MTTPSSVQDDLAFLRAITDSGVARRHQAIFGRIYFGAGVIYGVQIALSIATNAGLFKLPGGDFALSMAANGLFLVWMIWELWKNRGVGEGTMTNKAINAAFAAIGTANLAVCAILFVGAARLNEPMVSVMIPCVIFALQGAAWFVAYILRRRLWLGALAAGWMAVGIAMAMSLGDTLTFLSLIAVGVVFCMALPGYVMMRIAARQPA